MNEKFFVSNSAQAREIDVNNDVTFFLLPEPFVERIMTAERLNSLSPSHLSEPRHNNEIGGGGRGGKFKVSLLNNLIIPSGRGF